MSSVITPKQWRIILVIFTHLVILVGILEGLNHYPVIIITTRDLLWSSGAGLIIVFIIAITNYKVLHDIPRYTGTFLFLLGIDLLLVIAGNGYFLAAAGLSIAGQSAVSHNSMDGLYLSAMTFTTVGYGDVTPAPGVGRLIAAIEALTSYVLLALFIANIIELAKRPKPGRS